ncbi:hypothetical protein BGZ97_000661 [Linnemannia gamsii]|uniref:Uncharacterized protein n=1 Tax=Linnemannia gamsii TaxID=64522 RepID=A0A9P6QZC5_9FUNG|nr:hypothetical protein BGZ97_000661 [Linnemannia gamsii]
MGAVREPYEHLGNIVEFGLDVRSSEIRFVPDTHRVATAVDTIGDIVSGGERGLNRLVGAFCRFRVVTAILNNGTNIVGAGRCGA